MDGTIARFMFEPIMDVLHYPCRVGHDKDYQRDTDVEAVREHGHRWYVSDI